MLVTSVIIVFVLVMVLRQPRLPFVHNITKRGFTCYDCKKKIVSSLLWCINDSPDYPLLTIEPSAVWLVDPPLGCLRPYYGVSMITQTTSLLWCICDNPDYPSFTIEPSEVSLVDPPLGHLRPYYGVSMITQTTSLLWCICDNSD